MKYGLYKRAFTKLDYIEDTFYWLDKKKDCVSYFTDGRWFQAAGTPKGWCNEFGMEPSSPLIFLILTGHHFEAPK
jgi:hypothetical protein